MPCAAKSLWHVLRTNPSAQALLGGFSTHMELPAPCHPHPGAQSHHPRGQDRAIGHPLSCFCLVRTVGCQKGLSSGTASLESLRQLSGRHGGEHTYTTLLQLSNSRVKHNPPAAPHAVQRSAPTASLTHPPRTRPPGASPGGQQGPAEEAGQ